ncbi:MAG: hypothetical protein JSS87_03840 [Acidobacteria bacterium]|nr:hypothetical protein [Acidobacteriota bacterium]
MNSVFHTRLADLLRLFMVGALSLVLTGCHHRRVQAASIPAPVVETEPAPPVTVPPPTHITPDAELVQPEAPPQEEPVPPKAKPPVKRPTPKPVAPPPVTTPPPTPPVNSLGVLSAGGEASAQTRNQVEGMLRSVQQRMNAVPVDVQATHHDQYERVRNFVKQAEDAWKGADVEGTRNLATKARVLLDEMQR